MSSRRCISLSTLVLTLAVAASGCITSKLDHERSEEFVDTAWEFHSPTDPAALILTGSADSTGCGIVDSAVLRAGNDRRKVPSDLGMLWGIHHWPLSP